MSERAERRHLSTSARLLYPAVPSNRFISLAFCVVLATVFAIQVTSQDDGAADAGGTALAAAIAVFLSWAIARELDPDHPRTATIATIAALAILLAGQPRLGAVVALLFAVRVAAGTTGLPPTPLDLVWLPGVAAYAALSPAGFIAGFALAGALGLVAMAQPTPQRQRTLVSAVIADVAALTVAIAHGTIAPDPQAPDAAQWALIAVTALAAAALLRDRPAPTSLGDLTHAPLSGSQVVNARRLAVGAAVLTVAWLGGPALPGLVGLTGAVIAVGLTPRGPVRPPVRPSTPERRGT